MTRPTEFDDHVAQNLAEALVASSNAPVLLLDDALTIVAASASFCQAFQIDPTTIHGAKLGSIGQGEWNAPQVASLLKATADGHAAISAYEMDLARPDKPVRRLVLSAQKLDYGGAHATRMLITVADVTDARAAEKLKDDLLRERDILFRELQHRVANSLQIIASVLMQSAQRVNSDETRRHLYDAHNRVMSVASLQQRLAKSTLGDVALRPYFNDLCDSIGASMIHNRDILRLEVDVDDSIAGADVSVSLGLIVTELVINALKHAFPGGRGGKIVVGYHALGADWTLGVRDDGVGMPLDRGSLKSGLGSSIVAALAQQLDAVVAAADAHPGTDVTVIHRKVAGSVVIPLAAAI